MYSYRSYLTSLSVPRNKLSKSRDIKATQPGMLKVVGFNQGDKIK